MLVDAARNIETGSVLEADICIIGAGAAGLTLANELSDAGIDAVILESGGLELESDIQDLSHGETDDPAKHVHPSMYRQRRVGGSTAIWGGRCVPFDPIDFETREGAPGWPISYESVARWYPTAAKYCETGAADFSDSALARQRPYVAGFVDEDVRCNTIERFSPPTRFGRRWIGALRRADVRLVYHATVTKLAQSPGAGAVEYAQCATLTGRTFTVRARLYVLCVGGLETVRLLASSDDLDPCGIGNRSAQLGRNYMSHVEGQFAKLQITPGKRPISHGFERSRDGIYCRRRITLSEEAMRRNSLRNIAVRLHHPVASDANHRDGILSAMYLVKRWIIPEYARKLSTFERAVLAQTRPSLLAHVGNLLRDAPRLGLFAVDWTVRRYMVKRRIPHVVLRNGAGIYDLEYNAEQVPNPSSRVLLTSKRDKLGMRRLRVEWRMADQDARSIAGAHMLIQKAFSRSGAASVEFPHGALEEVVRENSVAVGGHHLGTARMSSSPQDGVVDASCRVHDSPNLYVCGGAVFPTCGAANPTLTVVALALRLAEHVRAALRRPQAQVA